MRRDVTFLVLVTGFAILSGLIVFRMLNNLKGIYASQGEWPKVVRTIDLMLAAQPGASGEYRDRGAAHLRAGDLKRARADFEHYLLNAKLHRRDNANRESRRFRQKKLRACNKTTNSNN